MSVVLPGINNLPAEAQVLYPFTVQIKTVKARDRYNKPVYNTPVAYLAYIEAKRKLITSAAGEEVVSNNTVYLASGDDVPGESVVVFPDSSSKDILSTARHADENGWFITTLYC